MGYSLGWKLLNAKNYGVPQERSRLFIVGYHQDMDSKITFPEPTHGPKKPLLNKTDIEFEDYISLKEAIGSMPDAIPARDKNKSNGAHATIPANHEFMTGGFSTIYMSRNRKKDWDDASFTIQAGGRHAPLHPSAHKMIKVEQDIWEFDNNTKNPYRRLSVRECARIQSFPDDFIFYYDSISNGYKMVGNAVPVNLAYHMATKIKETIINHSNPKTVN